MKIMRQQAKVVSKCIRQAALGGLLPPIEDMIPFGRCVKMMLQNFDDQFAHRHTSTRTILARIVSTRTIFKMKVNHRREHSKLFECTFIPPRQLSLPATNQPSIQANKPGLLKQGRKWNHLDRHRRRRRGGGGQSKTLLFSSQQCLCLFVCLYRKRR